MAAPPALESLANLPGEPKPSKRPVLAPATGEVPSRPSPHGLGSNAQHQQCNRGDTEDQNDQRNRVVIEPMPAVNTHDASLKTNGRSTLLRQRPVMAFASFSRSRSPQGSFAPRVPPAEQGRFTTAQILQTP